MNLLEAIFIQTTTYAVAVQIKEWAFCTIDKCFIGKSHLGDPRVERCHWNSKSFWFEFQEPDETALHLAVRSVDRTSLHIVDFLVQNRWVSQN